MQEISVTVQGSTPLLCNRFFEEAQLAASSGVRKSVVGTQRTPKEQAELKLYKDLDGKPMIPTPNIFRCLIDDGTFFKNGKSKVTTQKSSLIPACVEIEGVAIPIKSKEGWTVDTRPVRIPATGGRILAHRPCFNDWKLSFILHVDTEIISVDLVYDILEASGKRIGLGDFRPNCKGVFGKFRIITWTAMPEKKKKK